MNIIYDIDVLGVGYAHKQNRTGVFRVVENIANGITASSNCNPRWYAHHDIANSRRYLEDHSHLNKYPFLLAISRQAQLQRYFKQLERNALERYRGRPDEVGLAEKIYRKLLFTTHRLLIPHPVEEKLYYNRRLLSSANIFHATWWKPEAKIRENKHLTFIYNIYDLIPILYPQYTQYNEDYPSKRMMEDMDEGSWGFSISQASKNDLCNYFRHISPDQILVTPLAASRDIFYALNDQSVISRIQEKYGIPPEPYFLSLCTLAPHKNVAHVIRCFARLIQEENLGDLNLVLVGNKGWEFDKVFEEVAKTTNSRLRIIFTGHAEDEDLAAIYSGSIGFLFLSFYEGFGLPPLEAMQCGVPVITSNTSSLPEVVGEAGIMLDPRDEDALCQTMLNVYQDSTLRAEMARKSLVQAAKFSWEKCVEQTIEGYKIALNS